MSARLGRPTDNPKDVRITVRLDAECANILTAYCKRHKFSKTDAVREGIKRLQDKK